MDTALPPGPVCLAANAGTSPAQPVPRGCHEDTARWGRHQRLVSSSQTAPTGDAMQTASSHKKIPDVNEGKTPYNVRSVTG